MVKTEIDTIIIDFDSTILKGELLEMIAQTALSDNPDKEKIIKKISEITAAGMEGKISFSQSLAERLSLIPISQDNIDICINETMNLINEDYLLNIDSLLGKEIFVVSGGYKDMIDPTSEKIRVAKNKIFANKFILKDGVVTGLDMDNPLTKSDGKARIAQKIKSCGKKLIIGDGMTDYLAKEGGGADFFAAYTGIVAREKVIEKADFVLESFADLKKFIK